MQTRLYVRNLAIVEQVDLVFEKGFSVLTGETGAGKSILIDALALLLGARADTGLIRHGTTKAEVMAAFEIDNDSDAAKWLIENDLFDDEECVLRRLIHTDKPTRAFINGRPAPIQWLRDLGSLLVDIHGQHEHQSLLRRDIQRQILDDFAEHQPLVADLAERFEEIRSLQTRFDEMSSASSDRNARIDLLRYQVEELAALSPSEGEYVLLTEEHGRLANADALMGGLRQSLDDLYDADEGSVQNLISATLARISALSEFDPTLESASELLNEALISVEEATKALRAGLDRVDNDPARLNEVDSRLVQMHDLGRKHQTKPDALPGVFAAMSAELAEFDDGDGTLEGLAKRIEALTAEYRAIAEKVTHGRKKASDSLSREVSEAMQHLGMSGSVFHVAVDGVDNDEPTRYGLDQIEFQVSANPGSPPKSIAKVASGGELSRISLAIQVIIAAIGRVPTLVFDEVDVGIGGGVAEVVGQQLRRLGQEKQVVCITHLPQVAAQAQKQYQVAKHSDDNTRVDVSSLSEDQRVAEIARMLGGVELTDQSKAHAEEMLERAAM